MTGSIYLEFGPTGIGGTGWGVMFGRSFMAFSTEHPVPSQAPDINSVLSGGPYLRIAWGRIGFISLTYHPPFLYKGDRDKRWMLGFGAGAL